MKGLHSRVRGAERIAREAADRTREAEARARESAERIRTVQRGAAARLADGEAERARLARRATRERDARKAEHLARGRDRRGGR